MVVFGHKYHKLDLEVIFMSERPDRKKLLLQIASYVLVAALASAATLFFFGGAGSSKLAQLEALLERKYIGEFDTNAMEDAAADAMVAAIGDRWSYYMTAEEYASYTQRKKNSYVGIGVTVTAREDGTGLDIIQVEPDGAAVEAGIQPGDILVAAEGQSAATVGIDGIREIIQGEEGTTVTITVLRDGVEMAFTMSRKSIPLAVAEGKLLPRNIGLVKINNFNTNCAKETIAAVEELREQGAQALVLDVRNNPGGYVDELVKLLDHLLPEGTLFRSVEYTGRESIDYSDDNCVELPMAVLINGNSYSAAEFFAAALDEYDWAAVVGEPTSGKGYYQVVEKLSDGSAVNLSVGKYYTPNGINLNEAGGLQPEILVEVDDQLAADIYAGIVAEEDDPQLQAAIAAVQKDMVS